VLDSGWAVGDTGGVVSPLGSLRWAEREVIAVAGKDRTRRSNAADGPRGNRVVVKLTDDELKWLTERAAPQGVTIQGLMVAAALSDSVESVTERRRVGTELMRVQRLIGGTADNMNQIAKKANTVHEVPSNFAAAIEEARATWSSCAAILEQLAVLNRKAGV
jgi:hypothetical protein